MWNVWIVRNVFHNNLPGTTGILNFCAEIFMLVPQDG